MNLREKKELISELSKTVTVKNDIACWACIRCVTGIYGWYKSIDPV